MGAGKVLPEEVHVRKDGKKSQGYLSKAHPGRRNTSVKVPRFVRHVGKAARQLVC